MLLFTEEVILSEEKTSTEEKIKIMEGGFMALQFRPIEQRRCVTRLVKIRLCLPLCLPGMC